LYDLNDKNIEYEEYARVFYMRKILGSMIVKAQEYNRTLTMLVGYKNEPEMYEKLDKDTK
jgi:hypothetical protein